MDKPGDQLGRGSVGVSTDPRSHSHRAVILCRAWSWSKQASLGADAQTTCIRRGWGHKHNRDGPGRVIAMLLY